MYLRSLSILNYKNIREADLSFSDKMNCFVGLNGQGKTNLLDAIYLLSFTKSAFSPLDNLNITHGCDMAMVQGVYQDDRLEELSVTCGLRRGMKKQFRRGSKDYSRLIDHVGLIPLVMVSPEDSNLIVEGSEERRRFMDGVIAQYDKPYLEHLTRYNTLLRQRNALLKQLADKADEPEGGDGLLAVYEQQMAPLAQAVYAVRKAFIETFIPVFQSVYSEIAEDAEQVSLRYVSQLQDRDLEEAYVSTRQRDMILGWTSQGVHKDELEMMLDGYPIKQVGSQGQQKTYLMAMKLAQAVFLSSREALNAQRPVLLLDDIFDKLDTRRVQRIIRMLQSDRFGQIFITDTDLRHLTSLLGEQAHVFHVQQGVVTQ